MRWSYSFQINATKAKGCVLCEGGVGVLLLGGMGRARVFETNGDKLSAYCIRILLCMFISYTVLTWATLLRLLMYVVVACQTQPLSFHSSDPTFLSLSLDTSFIRQSVVKVVFVGKSWVAGLQPTRM